MLNIREMRASDWQDVARIYAEGIKTGVATLESEVPSYEKWDAAHLKICRLVAESDNSLAGWAVLSPVSTRLVYAGVAEVSVYVSEHARGQKAGAAILGALIDESERQGIWTLQSSILEENKASVALHLRCGFRTVGVRERLGRDVGGVWHNIILMERRSRR
jgi:phosphinothricin acetyltransferase